MNDIFFYTLYDQNNKPRCVGIRDNDKINIYDIYRPGSKRPIRSVLDTIAEVRNYVLQCNDLNIRLITSDFKRFIKAFNMPIDDRKYNIYDLHLDSLANFKSTDCQSKDYELVRRILDKMYYFEILPYQSMISNAAIVYQDLENRGLYVNYHKFYPEWSMSTFSGRSKSLGFNIQGYHENHNISTEYYGKNILIHFDWIAADIRVAAIMSGDQALSKSFEISDPYAFMMDQFNNEEQALTREECKLYLLKSINSLNISNNVLRYIYPDLNNWLVENYSTTRNKDAVLKTILGRKFRLSKAKNDLAVINGMMQGSVAHAMHIVFRRLWEVLGSYLIAEIHDSIVFSVPEDPTVIKSVINIAKSIMMYPFDGILPDNPCFPIRVSIGKKWKLWRPYKVYRKDGAGDVQKAETDIQG